MRTGCDFIASLRIFLLLAAFPHSPKLVWLLRNLTTSDLKDRVGEKSLSMQEVELNYLRSAFSSLDPASSSAQFYDQFYSVFPEQSCFPVPAKDSSSFDKRIEKLSRTLIESGRNRYMKGVLLNGPLFSSILVSMLAHRPSVFQVRCKACYAHRRHCSTP